MNSGVHNSQSCLRQQPSNRLLLLLEQLVLGEEPLGKARTSTWHRRLALPPGNQRPHRSRVSASPNQLGHLVHDVIIRHRVALVDQRVNALTNLRGEFVGLGDLLILRHRLFVHLDKHVGVRGWARMAGRKSRGTRGQRVGVAGTFGAEGYRRAS